MILTTKRKRGLWLPPRRLLLEDVAKLWERDDGFGPYLLENESGTALIECEDCPCSVDCATHCNDFVNPLEFIITNDPTSHPDSNRLAAPLTVTWHNPAQAEFISFAVACPWWGGRGVMLNDFGFSYGFVDFLFYISGPFAGGPRLKANPFWEDFPEFNGFSWDSAQITTGDDYSLDCFAVTNVVLTGGPTTGNPFGNSRFIANNA